MRMNILVETKGKTYVSVAMDVPSDFERPFPDSLFPCLVWDHTGRFTDAQRTEVAEWLLEAGCRYAVCGGQNCEAWHDAFDDVFFRRHMNNPAKRREEEHVMTSWHEEETPDDVAFFFVANTNFADHDFKRYLVLHIDGACMQKEVDAAVQRYALDEEAV